MNKLKEVKEEKKLSKKAPKKQGQISRSVSDVVKGNFLAKDNLVNSLPFFFFIIFLALCYIGNGYYAEDTVRELNTVSNDLKELRSEYITTKSELMFKSKQSEVARAIEPYGIKESVVPPSKVVVKKIKEE